MSVADLEAGARAVARKVDAQGSVVPAWDWRALLQHHRERVGPALAKLADAAELIDRVRRIEAGEFVAEDAWLRARAAQLLHEATAVLIHGRAP